jgi:small subunit ribosomal protein S6
MNQNNHNYRATFILDNRGKEDSVDSIVDGLKKEIASLQGEVTGVENLGRRDFSRVTDRQFPSGVYVQLSFTAPAGVSAQLHEKLRLNQSVYRTLLESA